MQRRHWTKPAAQAEPKMKVAVTSAKTPDYVEGRRSFFPIS